MSRLLNDLDPDFRPFAVELIAQCVEARIPVLIVTTGRTATEQEAAVAAGNSAVKFSKHQRVPGGRGPIAIDLAPWEVYQAHGPDKINWDAGDTHNVKEPWLTMGKIGEALGLRWGGRWHHPFDPGHFEMKES